MEQLFLFVEHLDQSEICLPYSRLLAGIPILAVFQNLRWNSNKTSQQETQSPTLVTGEKFELLGIVSGGYSFADNLYCFVAHQDILPWIKTVTSSFSLSRTSL